MLLLIVVILLAVMAVVTAIRSGALAGRSTALGTWSLLSGLGAALGVALIGQATFGWAPGFDPPGWLRVVAALMIPAGVIASAILAALSLKRYSGRKAAIAGLALSALAVVAFFAMVTSVEY